MFVVMFTDVGWEFTLDGVTGTAGAGAATAVVAAVEAAAFVPAAPLLAGGVTLVLVVGKPGVAELVSLGVPVPDGSLPGLALDAEKPKPLSESAARPVVGTTSPTPSAADDSLARALALLVVVLSPCWTTTVAPAAVRPRAIASMMAIGRRWGMRDPVVTGSAGAAR
jgi:hypothetical protein